MTRRYYLPSSGAAPIVVAYDSAWGDTSQADKLGAVFNTPSGTPFTAHTVSSSSIQTVLARQYVTPALTDTLHAPTFAGGEMRVDWSNHQPFAIVKIFRIVDGSGVMVNRWGNIAIPTVDLLTPSVVPGSLVVPYQKGAIAFSGIQHSAYGYMGLYDEYVRLFPGAYQPGGVASDQGVTINPGYYLVVEIGVSIKLTTGVTVNFEFGDADGTDIPLTFSNTGPFPQHNPWIDLVFPTHSTPSPTAFKKSVRYHKPFAPTHHPSVQQYPAVPPVASPKFNQQVGNTRPGNR